MLKGGSEMILLRLMIVGAAVFMFSTPSYAVETILCKRISIDSSGFVDFGAAASWYPEKIRIRIRGERAFFVGYSHRKGEVIKNKSNGRLEIRFISASNSSANNVLKFQRFTKGNPYLDLQHKAGFTDTGRAYYDCD